MATSTHAPWQPIYFRSADDDLDALDPAVLSAVQGLAQQLLFAKGGRRHGTITVTGETYRAATSSACVSVPYLGDDLIWRTGVAAAASCCCLTLFNRPVRSVQAVRLSGAVLASTGYVLEHGTLRRVGTCWPAVAADEPAVIEVDYTWGVDVAADDAARLAYGELILEMVAGITGEACRLPSAVTNIARQGVSYTLLSPRDLDEIGKIGLPLCDAWLSAVNPNGNRARSRVLSPARSRRVR